MKRNLAGIEELLINARTKAPPPTTAVEEAALLELDNFIYIIQRLRAELPVVISHLDGRPNYIGDEYEATIEFLRSITYE